MSNSVTGTLTTGLGSASSGDTGTLATSWMSSFPAVAAGQIAAVVLDSTASAGAPEIVWITAHTAAASSATIVRGMENSTARAHSAGVTCIQGPTKFDFYDQGWLDARLYGLIPASGTDNTAVLQSCLAIAGVGGTWGYPLLDYDKPLPVRLPAGMIDFSGQLNVLKASGLIGAGPGSTFLNDTRTSSLTKTFTVSTTNNSEAVTVTAGTQDLTNDLGLFVTGSGIPTRTYITTNSAGALTLSKDATATATGVTLTVYTAVSIRLAGSDASTNQVDDWLLEGFQLQTDNTGHDSKTGLLLRNAGNGRLNHVYVFDYGCGIKGVNWWDSSVRDCRLDWCGSRDGGSGAGKGWGALHLTASDVDTTDCDALLFDHLTTENCHEHDVVIVGHGRRVNKIGFTNRSKFETSKGRGHRVLIDTADHVTFDPTCDFSVGDWDTSYTTAQDVLNLTNVLGFCADGVMIEQKTGLATATVRHGIHFAGSTTCAPPRGLRMSNGGGNPTITGAPIYYTGTNTVLGGWGGWTYDGSGSEPQPATNGSSFKVARKEYTPTLSGSGGNPNLGASGVAIGRYQVIDNTVTGNAYFKWSGASMSSGTGLFTISCPITPREDLIDDGASSVICGRATLVEAGSTGVGSHVVGSVHVTSSGNFLIVPESAAQVDSAYVSSATPWTWGTTGDAIHIDFCYEAAS